MMRIRRVALTMLTAVGLSISSGASFGKSPESSDPIFFSVNDWTGVFVSSHVMGGVLESMGYNVEYRIVLKDKTERVLQDEGEVRCDKHNKPVRIFGVIQDITERKNFEKALFNVEEKG